MRKFVMRVIYGDQHDEGRYFTGVSTVRPLFSPMNSILIYGKKIHLIYIRGKKHDGDIIRVHCAAKRYRITRNWIATWDGFFIQLMTVFITIF